MLANIQWIKEEYEYNFVPKDMGWSIKVIGKTGFGKRKSLSGLVEFFIQYFKPAILYILLVLHLSKRFGIEWKRTWKSFQL